MGLHGLGYLLNQLRQKQHLANEGQLVGVSEQRYVSCGPVDALLTGFVQYAGDASMAVLDVVNRVFRRLSGCQLKVEVHLGFGSPGQEEVAAGVGTHLVHQLPQSHELTGPLGDLDHLLAPLEGHHL